MIYVHSKYAILHIFTYLIKVQLFLSIFNTYFYIFYQYSMIYRYSKYAILHISTYIISIQ